MPGMTWGWMFVTLKLNRFELLVAIAGALIIGTWAAYIVVSLGAIAVPDGCIDGWIGASDPRPQCLPAMNDWASLLVSGSADLLWWAQIIPFVIGIVAGAPIIAREVELGTAHTTWTLFSSRSRWLVSQLVPVMVAIAIAVAAASVATELVAGLRERVGLAVISDIGMHGLTFAMRVAAAFGVGLLVGAVVARSVPSVVIGVVVFVLVIGVLGVAREAWFANQPRAALDPDDATAVTTTWLWRDPTGELVTDEIAMSTVPADVAALDRGSAQAVESMNWLEGAGYDLVPVGITQDQALGWQPYEAGILAMLCVGSVSSTFLVVRRRRI